MNLVAGKDNIDVRLEADEQLTFHAPDGGEYDVAAKEWGCYLTPSILGRLAHFGLRAALVGNGAAGARRLAIVQTDRADDFLRDVAVRGFDVQWLDAVTIETMMSAQSGKIRS